MGNYLGLALYGFIGLSVGTLIGGIALFAAVRLIARFEPSLGAAFKTVLLASACNAVIGLSANWIMRRGGLNATFGSSIVLLLVGWFVYAFFVTRYVRHPQSGAIGFPRALQISLTANVLVGLAFAAVYFGFATLRH